MKVHLAVLCSVLMLAAGCSGTTPNAENITALVGADESVVAEAAGAPIGCMAAQGLLATAAPLNLREGPSADSAIRLVMPEGAELAPAADSSCPENGYYKVRFSGFEGWAYGAWLRTTEVSTSSSALTSANTRDEAINRAKSGVGFSYWWAHGRWLGSGATSSNRGSCSGGCPSCSHSGSYGADCSGFAAKVWVVPSTNDVLSDDSHPYSTYNFDNEYHGWHDVSRGSIRRADAMVHNESGSGHIFIYESGDGWGSMYTYECTGCAAGCVHQLRTAGSAYKAISRDNIADTTPPPTTPKAKRGDVNGDGRADLVSLSSSGDGFFWPGQAGGTFANAIASFNGTMDPALFDKTGHYLVDVADVDGNGMADLVTVTSSGYAYVYSGNDHGFSGGVASFNGTMQLRDVSGAGHEPVGVADVTGDGKADLVTLNGGYAYVYPGTSTRAFGSGVASFNGTLNSALYDRDGHYAVGVADVTGDGKADLVTVHTSGYAYVYPGTSTGAFGSGVASFSGTLDLALPDGVGHEPVDVADVNGDGKADLVTVHTNGYAYVYPGTSTGAFNSAVSSFAGTLNTSLFDQTGHEIIGVLDITGDGKGDLVTTSGGTAYVYPGTSTGAFGGSVSNFAGTLDASRFDGVGHEFASERIISRRRGCTASGC